MQILSQSHKLRRIQQFIFIIWICSIIFYSTANLYHYTIIEPCIIEQQYCTDGPIQKQEVVIIKNVYPLLGKVTTEIFKP